MPAKGHGGYITATPEWGLPVSVGKWPLHITHTHTHTHIYISLSDSRGTIGAFYAYFHKHARRLRLEKLLHPELSRSSSGFLNHF
jgi:hypothetical protein